MYPPATPEVAARCRGLAPDIKAAWDRFSSAVFTAGALDEATKQLIAVAVAYGNRPARPRRRARPGDRGVQQ